MTYMTSCPAGVLGVACGVWRVARGAETRTGQICACEWKGRGYRPGFPSDPTVFRFHVRSADGPTTDREDGRSGAPLRDRILIEQIVMCAD